MIETVRWFSFRRLQVGRGSVSTNCTCFLAPRSRRLARGNRDWKCLRALRAPRVSEPSHSADKKRSDRRNRAPRRRFRPAAPESARHALLQAPRFVQLGDRPMCDNQPRSSRTISARVAASSFLLTRTDGAQRPLRQDRHFSETSSFHIGVSRGRRMASSGRLARVMQRLHSTRASQPAVEALTDRGRRLGRPSPPA
jgi:hypothetical protein